MTENNTLTQAIADRDHAEQTLARINGICHVPSNGKAAYSHFMRDFDEIRKLTAPFVSFPISLPNGHSGSET
jgi:hypothetical protein